MSKTLLRTLVWLHALQELQSGATQKTLRRHQRHVGFMLSHMGCGIRDKSCTAEEVLRPASPQLGREISSQVMLDNSILGLARTKMICSASLLALLLLLNIPPRLASRPSESSYLMMPVRTSAAR